MVRDEERTNSCMKNWQSLSPPYADRTHEDSAGNSVDTCQPSGRLKSTEAVEYEAIVSHLRRAYPGDHILPILMRLISVHLP